MGKSKRLVFITTRIFWPTNSGRKVSLYYYCKGLHEIYGYEISLFCFLEAGQGESDLYKKPGFIKEVRLAKSISPFTKISNLLCKSFGKNRWPLQCSLFYSNENCNAISSYCAYVKPDLVITDMIRTAPYLDAYKSIGCLKILDMDDLLSKRYERQVASATAQGEIAGLYSKKLPKLVNQLINAGGIRKKVLSIEISRLKSMEVKWALKFDKVIFVSERETEEFNHRTGIANAYTVTMGVDYDYYSSSIIPKTKTGTLSFIGNMSYPPNLDSFEKIVEHVMPLIKHPIIFRVIGNCPKSLHEKYDLNERIELCGIVDDHRKAIKETEVFLAPISYGSGIKTKILEAMAMGMPVVTNAVGAEGIMAQNGKDFFVTDDYEVMAQIVDKLLDDPALCRQVGANAQEFILKNHTWEKVYEAFGKMGL